MLPPIQPCPRPRPRLRRPLVSALAAVAAVFLTVLPPATARQEEFRIPPATAQKIGHRIWQNECAGTVAGLTSWNRGEGFASLGIGHFIWYPAGTRRTYEESFPSLARFLAQRGAKVPKWALAPDCPWPDRASFTASANTPKMRELRGLLASTIALQGEFAARRSLRSLPKILDAAPRHHRAAIESRFRTLSTTPAGLYCLMDYVNFKGEGTNPAERYKGVGWGLLQVLENMSGNPGPREAPAEFAAAARRTLDRRIKLAPKDETQWRAGWFNRCASYAKGL